MPARTFNQGRLAGSVGADDTHPLFGRDQPVEIFEQCFGAEAFAGGAELNHECNAGGRNRRFSYLSPQARPAAFLQPVLPLSRTDHISRQHSVRYRMGDDAIP